MSLSVSIFTGWGDDFEIVATNDEPNAVGGEDWRWLIWGGEVAHSHGLVVLSKLAKEDIYAVPTELDLLEREVRVVATNAHEFSAKTKTTKDDIQERCGYILRAIERARQTPGAGVVIW